MLTDSLNGTEQQSVSSSLARLLLRLLGWKLVGHLPQDESKYLMIGAPHTSRWDYPLTLLCLTAFRVKPMWLSNKVLFSIPLRPLTRLLGGLPPSGDERTKSGFVNDMITIFNTSDSVVLGLVPEGTSAFVPRWKSGFYHIALGAKSPIIPGYIDYRTRTIGFGPIVMPSGDSERDLAVFNEFYKDKVGKHPERASPVKI